MIVMDSSHSFRSQRQAHTLFFQTGRWALQGYFQSALEKRIAVRGHLAVQANKGDHQLHFQLFSEQDKLVLERNCQMSFRTGSKSGVLWQEQSVTFGQLYGQLTVVDDTLLLHLDSGSASYRVIESFLRVFDDEYELRGAVLEQEKQDASWTLELVRVA
jgi:hypothetical protein